MNKQVADIVLKLKKVLDSNEAGKAEIKIKGSSILPPGYVIGIAVYVPDYEEPEDEVEA